MGYGLLGKSLNLNFCGVVGEGHAKILFYKKFPPSPLLARSCLYIAQNRGIGLPSVYRESRYCMDVQCLEEIGTLGPRVNPILYRYTVCRMASQVLAREFPSRLGSLYL